MINDDAQNGSRPRSLWRPQPEDGDAVLIAYSVKERVGKTAIWTRIGAAYPHNTGAGLTVVLDALPVGNRIVLLEPKDDA